jgi:hypothetical protein
MSDQPTGEFGTLNKFGETLGGIVDILKGDITGGFTQLAGILGDEVILYLDQTTQLYSIVNEQMAMTGDLAAAYREELMDASVHATKLGVSFNEMTESVTKLVAGSGKFKLLSSDTIKEMALASKFTDDMRAFADMGRSFELIGLGIRDMSELVKEMGLKSLTLGLNARTTTSLVNENLKNLNQYGFKSGVEGLNRMAQKSVEFRMNMDSVFKMADKVWEPDKALELVANLQVIGGAFGDLNDPIKMMYMATNNVEGLQDAIIGAAQSLVTYNEEQGRFQITGANLRRAKAMADEPNMSMEELSNVAIAGAERTQAAFDLMGTGLDMDEEDREFLTNLSRMEGGRMIIEIPESLRDEIGLTGEQTQIALDELTDKQAKLILDQKKQFEETDMEDIARQQVTLIENIERDMSFVRGALRVSVGQNAAHIIENALGINQRKLSELSDAVSNWGAGQVGRFDDFAKEAVRQYEDLKLLDEPLKKLTDKINEASELVKNDKGKQTESPNPPEPPPTEVMNRNEEARNKRSERERESTRDYNVNLRVLPLSSAGDEIGKIIWGDPKFQERFTESFLHPFEEYDRLR